MQSFPNEPSDPQPDWVRLLPREAFQEIMLTLRSALPPPAVDDPLVWARRDRAAMAGVAALLPVTAAEGRLAAQFVAADAWAMDCLRLAVERRREFEVARKCRAQAMSLMRESKSALRVLLRMQAARRAVEADEAASGQAAWAEHAAVGMMAAALDGGVDAGRVPLSPASAPQDVDGRHKAGHDGRGSDGAGSHGEASHGEAPHGGASDGGESCGSEAEGGRLERRGHEAGGIRQVSPHGTSIQDSRRETVAGFRPPPALGVARNAAGGT